MRLMRVRDAAEALGVKSDTVYSLVRAGKIGHFRVGNGRGVITFSEAHIDEYLASVEALPRCGAAAAASPAPRAFKSRHFDFS